MGTESSQDPRRILEALGVFLLLVAALATRSADLAAPWSRDPSTSTGALFAISSDAWGGPGRALGHYPRIDDGRGAPLAITREPPLAFWVACSGEALLAGRTTEGAPPGATERALRLTFLALHLLTLWALWWAVRGAYGSGAAMLALGIAAAVPVGTWHAATPHPAGLALALLVLMSGSYVRWSRAGSRAWLAATVASAAVLSFALRGAVLLVAPFALDALLRRRRDALLALALLGAATLTPAWIHRYTAAAVHVTDWSPDAGGLPPLRLADAVVRRAIDLFGGLAPAFGPALLVCAAFGVGAVVARASSTRLEARLVRWEVRDSASPGRVDLLLPLLVGAIAYRCLEAHGTTAVIDARHLLTLPAVTIAAALALTQISVPLFRLRGGLAPLVVLTLSVVLPGLAATGALRAGLRAPDGPAAVESDARLPEAVARAFGTLIPPAGVGLVPDREGLPLGVARDSARELRAFDAATDAPALLRAIAQELPGRDVRILVRDASPSEWSGSTRLRRSLQDAPLARSSHAGWTAFAAGP